MQEIFPSLFLLRPAEPTAQTPYTYLIKRPDGHSLFATKADMTAFMPILSAAGPVRHLLLGDRHHGAAHTPGLARSLACPILCSAGEARVLAKLGVPVDRPLDERRAPVAEDLEAIPTPGHTRGALSYLWTKAGQRFLFVGDTIAPIDGTWRTWVTRPNRPLMRETLSLLASLPVDVVLSNSFAASPVPWQRVTAVQWRDICADIARNLDR